MPDTTDNTSSPAASSGPAELVVRPQELRVGDILVAEDGDDAEIVHISRVDDDVWVDTTDDMELHLCDPDYRIRRPARP